MNFFEFMLNTYEDSKESKHDTGSSENQADGAPKMRGRPCSTRIPYQDRAGKGKHCRIQRSQDHETLPRFVGKWFCRSDTNNERDLFRASMLMLLKPWRDLNNLKSDMETFENTYDLFYMETNEKCHQVIANVQYYFECSDGAKAE
jgi:hypothetical protein